MSMWGDRSGREPVSARSALALRRVIAIGGSAVCLLGFVAFLLRDIGGPAPGLLLVLAVIGIGDVVLITRRLRRQRG